MPPGPRQLSAVVRNWKASTSVLITAHQPAVATASATNRPRRSMRSATIANTTERKAPTTIGVENDRSRPSVMNTPYPPLPTSAPTVTRPITVTDVMRRPAMIVGSANGTSICHRRRERV